MANRTVKDAHSVKGTNPQYLVEKITRTRIYECRYWKEECFALTAALIVDKAMELKYVGGVFGGNIKPVPFLCLLLKMLQIQPEKDIVVEFIKNEDFKYVRALGAIYMRLTGTSIDCYKYLEPLYYDYRKLKRIDRNGAFHIIHMDEFIDELLREERACDIILPRIQKRNVLEETNVLEPRISAIEEDVDEMESEEEDEIIKEAKKIIPQDVKPKRSPSPHRRRRSPPRKENRQRSPGRRRSRSRDRAEKRHRSPGRRHKEDSHKRSGGAIRSSNKRSRQEADHHDRDRDRHDHDRHRSSRHTSDKDRSRHRDKDKSSRDNREHRSHRDEKRGGRDEKSGKSSATDQEIKDANEMRAKLGLAPLKI